MPESQAAEVFLWVASVCIVLLTVIVAAAAIVVIRVTLQIRNIARRAQRSAMAAIDGARFARRWASAAGRRIFERYGG